MIVWIASYPRSGNRFTRTVLRRSFSQTRIGNVYSQSSESRLGAPDNEISLDDASPELVEELRASDDPVFVKTHRLADAEDDSPGLYLVRDGRDAVTSYARFAIAEGSPGFANRSFEDAAETLISQNDREIGTWSMNVRAWTRRDAPTAIVRFEELIEDPVAALRHAAGLIGITLPEDAKPPPTFEQLKSGAPQLFRRGQVGGWKSEMSARLEQHFWSAHGAEMLVLGYSRAHPHSVQPAAA